MFTLQSTGCARAFRLRRHGRPPGPYTATILVAAAILCAGCGTGADHAATTTRTVTTATQTRLAGPRSRDWLGLNYNSSAGAGDITDFARFGVVYDRLGRLAADAGQTVAGSPELSSGLRASTTAGMVPDVMISPVAGPQGCTTDPNGSHLCLPDGPAAVGAYVRGFVATVASIRRAFPHRQIIFEPMNEPWDWAPPPGTTSGAHAAAVYAAILARLLPAVRAARIPLSLVYVPATGILTDSSYWIPDLYRAEPCLRPGAGTCGPVEGWNFHPYGPPDSPASGIGAVPRLRRAMASGQDNIVISEMGFCVTGVPDSQCDENVPTVDGSSAQTAAWLHEALVQGRRMHDAGWLRALILWQRVGGGWAMQEPDGRLTAEGRVLIRFVRGPGR